MYQTIKKCKCIKSYIEKYRDYKDGKNGPIYTKATFEQDNIYHYKIIDELYYVGDKKKLRSINKYHDSLECFEEKDFKLFFDVA